MDDHQNKQPTYNQPVITGSDLPPPGLRQWLRNLRVFVWPPYASLWRRLITVGVAAVALFIVTFTSAILLNTGGVRDIVTNGGDGGPSSPFNGNGEDAETENEPPDNQGSETGQNDEEANNGENGNGSRPGGGGPSGSNGTGGPVGNGNGGQNGGSNGGGNGTPAGECPAFPAFPDQSCTGWQHTGVTLSSEGCPQELTQPGATYDGCLFTSYILVMAEDITITRSRIEGRVVSVDANSSLHGLTLADVEIDGMGVWDFNQAAIGNSDYTRVRCHIHSTGRGANLENNVRIEDSYLHGWVTQEGDHETAIGSNGGSGNKIIHNNLICNSSLDGCSAALSFYGDFAPVNDILVEKNLLNTNGSYCTYAGSVAGKPFPDATNVRYIDNHFGKAYHPGCGAFGPVDSWAFNTGNIWSGNVWADGSGAINL